MVADVYGRSRKMRAFYVYACDVGPTLLINGQEKPRGAVSEQFDTREEAVAYARSMYPKYNCVTVCDKGNEIARLENGYLIEGKRKTKI